MLRRLPALTGSSGRIVGYSSLMAGGLPIPSLFHPASELGCPIHGVPIDRSSSMGRMAVAQRPTSVREYGPPNPLFRSPRPSTRPTMHSTTGHFPLDPFGAGDGGSSGVVTKGD